MKVRKDDLDMTPMVDVTFLLLIFFMVTASFALQKALEQPHSVSELPSPDLIDSQIYLDDVVQVNIDQNNTYYVKSRDEEVECPSANELRSRVKDAKEKSNASRLVILAHVDSYHDKVITAWDSGVINGMDSIEIQTTNQDF